jgi:DNA-binding SARP family transcriptional activator
MLGPLEAQIDGAPVPLGGPKQRALVAILLIHANDVVPLDVLIDELWEGTPPPSAPAQVQNCVHRLRKLLGADALETRAPGYRLCVAPDQIDARRFEQLLQEARAMPTRERAAALREALGLWRGTPLSDLAYWSFAQDTIRNLEEQRVNAQQMCLEAELELGLHRETIGELDALVREHPTHERMRWLQMLALHRSSRRQDALAAYQEARLAIVEESGMEPGEALRALQRRILQDDPTLMPDGTATEEAAEGAPQLARKIVAVCIVELLVDEELDVEAGRVVAARGLASLEEIVLRHGGTVKQLLGEEAVAVFGLPAAHEDDLLRALRAVVELRDAVGVLPIRAAVETGEVLVGENGHALAGGALTTARRVKESAGEAEILLGPLAAAQTVGAAWTEPCGGAHRLIELVEGAPAIARRPDSPLVGRRAELEWLVVAVREVAASSSCRRIVVLGEPGIGKTRLAAELVRTLGDETRVVTGRCVPYAEGSTYLPLAEIVEQIAGSYARGPEMARLLAGQPDGERAATRLEEALSGSGAVDSGDVFWATRKLLEALAGEQPLLVVVEDVHWAEPTFLDLLEYLVGWSTCVPISLVCLARTELLDVRPAWAADTLALRPLGDEETAELLEKLPEALALDADARAAVVSAAEGNPLFLEQLAAHALDDPLETARVPASLESLLASRLDSLPMSERAVLERAAVVGREFTRAAVDALAGDGAPGAATALLALVRRRLVRPDTERPSDDAFLFDHALIRDATYAAVARAERARLHERLARWLDQRGELDEIVGHHLEQAAYALVRAGEDASHLEGEAAQRLGRAGERAVWSRDTNAAIALLSRAIALLPPTDTTRLELECLLSIPLKTSWEWARATELLDDVERRAREIADRRLELRAAVELFWPRFVADETDAATTMSALREAVRVCDMEGDLLGVARAWTTLVSAESRIGRRFDAAVDAARAAVEASARYGVTGLLDNLVVDALWDGTATLAEAIAFCEARIGAGLPRDVEASMLLNLAELKASTGAFHDARGRLEHARGRLRDLGDDVTLATLATRSAARIELLAGDSGHATAIAQPGLDAATARDDRLWQNEFLGVLADAGVLERDFEQALAATEEARRMAIGVDLHQALAWRRPRARSLAGLGRLDEAESLARESLSIVDATDYLLGRGEARVVLAEVLLAGGNVEAAVRVADEGAGLLEAKGATVLAERARATGLSKNGGEPGIRAPLHRPGS